MILCTGPLRLLETTAAAVAVQPLISVTVTVYIPAVRPVGLAVIFPFDHRYVYGEIPPPEIETDAVPSFNNGQLAGVAEADTIRLHAAHAIDGWNPGVTPSPSTPLINHGVKFELDAAAAATVAGAVDPHQLHWKS